MTLDLATVTREVFEAHKGERFVMRVAPDRAIDLELESTAAAPARPNAVRGSFLVRFRTADRAVVPQQIYALEHATLGAFELFLVPAAPDARGVYYDAVFG